ncbi:MAG: hypothetical protein ACOY7J_11640 [Pseudomonadota bacterium]
MPNALLNSMLRIAWRGHVTVGACCVMVLLPACTTVSTPKPALTEQRSAQNCSIHMRDLSSPWAHERYSCVSTVSPLQRQTSRIRNLLTQPAAETVPRIAGVKNE